MSWESHSDTSVRRSDINSERVKRTPKENRNLTRRLLIAVDHGSRGDGHVNGRVANLGRR